MAEEKKIIDLLSSPDLKNILLGFELARSQNLDITHGITTLRKLVCWATMPLSWGQRWGERLSENPTTLNSLFADILCLHHPLGAWINWTGN